jgi:hypothetical protein
MEILTGEERILKSLVIDYKIVPLTREISVPFKKGVGENE